MISVRVRGRTQDNTEQIPKIKQGDSGAMSVATVLDVQAD